MSRAFPVLVAFLGMSLGCGRDDPPPPPPPSNMTSAPAPMPPGAEPVAPATNAASADGTITLAPGFTPDPHIVRGQSGGAVSAANLSAGCAGWIAEAPSHVLATSASFSNLVIAVHAPEADTTLVVQRPDGSYVCDDDSEGMDPMTSGPIGAGSTRIWIGSYDRAGRHPYTLGLSELPGMRPSSLGATGAGGSAGATPLELEATSSNYGRVALAPGFGGPHVAQGTSGGSVNAAQVSARCTGWISSQPDHLFEASQPFSMLHVLVSASADTTLVVRGPDGEFRCDDDTHGLSPEVSGAFPAGTYRIWVGSYASGQNSPYRLGFTERSGVTPDALE